MTAILEAAVEAERAGIHLGVVAALETRELAATELQLVVDLILVRQIVHQAHAQRLVRQERALVDQRAHFGLGLVAAFGDAAHELIVEIRGHRLGHLAVRLRESLLGERVVGRLVVADVQ